MAGPRHRLWSGSPSVLQGRGGGMLGSIVGWTHFLGGLSIDHLCRNETVNKARVPLVTVIQQKSPSNVETLKKACDLVSYLITCL